MASPAPCAQRRWLWLQVFRLRGQHRQSLAKSCRHSRRSGLAGTARSCSLGLKKAHALFDLVDGRGRRVDRTELFLFFQPVCEFRCSRRPRWREGENHVRVEKVAAHSSISRDGAGFRAKISSSRSESAGNDFRYFTRPGRSLERAFLPRRGRWLLGRAVIVTIRPPRLDPQYLKSRPWLPSG
jgi:hypothetical protein